MKKYKLTNETITNEFGYTLFRIQAMRDFKDVKTGDLGGYIECEDNLSQEDNAWVYDRAQVYGQATICDDACARGNAKVFGAARLYDRAQVCNSAFVSGHAVVCNDAIVRDNATVTGKAFIRGNIEITNATYISKCAAFPNFYLCDEKLVKKENISSFDYYFVNNSGVLWKSNLSSECSFKDIILEFAGEYGEDVEFLKKCYAGFKDDDISNLIRIHNHFASIEIEKVYKGTEIFPDISF